MMWKVLAVLASLSLGGMARAAGDAYFPLVAGSEWKYRVTVKADQGAPAGAEQVVKVEAGELAGKNVAVAGDVAYEVRDDGVYVVGAVRGGRVEAIEEPQKVVPAEPKLGDKWTFREAGGGVTSATCLGTERVKVAAGAYDAVKIYLNTASGAGASDRREVYRWFAKGVGPVKGTVTDRRLEQGKVSTREVGLELVSVEIGGNAKPQTTTASSGAELFAQAETLAREGKHRDAVAKYDAAIAADPKVAKPHAYKALSLMAMHDWEQAEREASRAAAMDGKDYTFQEILGQVKVGQGQIAEGKALYDKAAATSPEHAGAVYTDLAAVLAARKEDRLAPEIDAALKRAAGAEPPSPEALFALGQSYVNAGRAEGKGYLQRYIEVASKLPADKRDETKIRLARQLIRALDAVKG
jgi:tetratricopeptide (TPR) repeat protein